MSLHVYIDTIPHDQQRYPTVGDYWRPGDHAKSWGRTEIRISEMQNEGYELLVAIHEMVEEYLTRKKGITEAEITAFDIAFEATREKGSPEEPGDSLDAPYYLEHAIATEIERYAASKLGIRWDKYEATVLNL